MSRTREEMIAILEEAERRKKEQEQDAWYEDFGAGIKRAGMETVYGIKELGGELSERDKIKLELARREAEGGWGTAGRVVGELAMLAVPGGLAVKGARGLGAAAKVARGVQEADRLRRASRALPVATDIAASAGLGAVQQGTTEERLDRAGEGALGAVGGAAIGKLARPLLGRSSIEVTDEAAELMSRGVRLTPGQAARSKAIQGLESASEVTPFTARSVKAARERGLREWRQESLKEVLPASLRNKVTGDGADAVDDIRRVIDDGYDEAWGTMGGTAAPRIQAETLQRLTDPELKVLGNALKDIKALQARDPNVSARQIDVLLRRIMPDPRDADRYELRKAIEELRTNYRKQLPAKQQAKLDEMDASWRNYLSVSQAASRGAEQGGEYNAKQLMQAVRTMHGRDAAARGRAPMQDIARLGTATVGRQVGGQPLEWFRRLAQTLPPLYPAQTIGDFALAQTPLQRSIARTLRGSAAERVMPYMVSPARIGGAIPENEEDY